MNQPSFQTTETAEFVDILFTDIRFHVAEPRKPLPLSRAIEKSIRSGQSGRSVTTSFSIKEDGGFRITFPTSPALERVISDAEKRGKTVRFMLPKEGLPVYAGKDMAEYLTSKKERRRTENNA